ncbi:MAG: glutaredoxin family protein [Candidatus Thermoplasmatota archaeon]|nr:glutaredoxin family protein [Candidatus Thermoplasmatota archaeon]
MNVVHVNGKNKGDIILYAISTCGWCKKTKSLLNSLGVEYRFINVDLLDKVEKEKIEEEVKRWNPKCNYPTMVINDKKCIVGYKEDEIREVVQL